MVANSINDQIKVALGSKVAPKSEEKKLLDGTCEWLEKIPKFQSWKSNEPKTSGLLWICGGPGKGKSHISAYLVSQLEKDHKSEVLNHFCDTRDILHSTELAVVLRLLKQLLDMENADDLYKVISDKFSGRGSDLFSRIYLGDLWDCLEKMIQKRSQSHQIYLVLDGLDECDRTSREKLTSQLRMICNKCWQEGKHTVKIVITSRPLNLDQLKLRQPADLMIDLHQNEILKHKG